MSHYHEFRSLWDDCRDGLRDGIPRSKFYFDYAKGCLGDDSEVLQRKQHWHAWCLVERQWFEDNEPYCLISPDILDPLCRSRLDIPASMVRLPHAVMLFRLPVGHGHEGLSWKGDEIACVLATMKNLRVREKGGAITPIFGLHFIAFCATSGDFISQIVPMDADRTVAEQFDAAYERFDAMETLTPVVSCVTRLLTQLAIIISGSYRVEGMDGLVNPDVLARDREQWHDPNMPDDGREQIRRRAHNGFVVGIDPRVRRGREIRVPSGSGDSGAGSGTSQPLEYGYWRRPHFHTFRCGPGRRDVVVKYLPPIRVRPDLPQHTRGKGYRV